MTLRRTVGLRKVSAKQAKENALRVVVKAQLVEKSKGHCQSCGSKGDWRGLQLSHTIPLSQGGRTDTQNCRILCALCHSVMHGLREAK